MRPTISFSSRDVSSFQYRADVYAAASDLLEGYSGDYIFFQADPDSYAVLYDLVNPVLSSGTFTASSATVYQIDCSSGSGWYTGKQYIGFSEDTVYEKDNVYLHGFTYTVSNISISNTSDSMVYSSFVGYPHLVEGVCKYEYAEILLLVIICCFVLFDLIFRRFYR